MSVFYAHSLEYHNAPMCIPLLVSPKFLHRYKKTTTSRCQSRLHTASETFIHHKKNHRTKFHFMHFCIHSKLFDRKGWRIRKMHTKYEVCKDLKEGIAHLGSLSNTGSCISSITRMRRGTLVNARQRLTRKKRNCWIKSLFLFPLCTKNILVAL